MLDHNRFQDVQNLLVQINNSHMATAAIAEPVGIEPYFFSTHYAYPFQLPVSDCNSQDLQTGIFTRMLDVQPCFFIHDVF